MATPEKLDADDALLEAIDRQHQLYYPVDGPPGMVTRYLVVAQRQWIDDGEFRSHIYVTTAEEMSIADVLGLIEFARVQFHKVITEE